MPAKKSRKTRSPKSDVLEEMGAIVAQGVTLAQLKARAKRTSFKVNKAILQAIIDQVEEEGGSADKLYYVAFGMSGGGHGGHN